MRGMMEMCIHQLSLVLIFCVMQGSFDDFLLLDGRNGWSLLEGELDAYIEEQPQPVHEDGEETEDNSVQPSNTWEFPYQQSNFYYAPSASSSREPDYGHANDDPPAWGDYWSWD
jgi:hypothetical protein